MKTKRRVSAFRNVCGFLYAVCLSVGVLSVVCHAAGFAPEDAYFRTRQTKAAGLTYEELYVDTNKTPQHAYVISRAQDSPVSAVVSCGKSVWGRYTAVSIAETENTAEAPVIAGVNADFFSFATGIPMGVLISGGEILSSDADANAFGIRADGTYLIGKPQMTFTLSKVTEGEEPYTVSVSHINKYPSVWGAYLSTPAFGKTTQAAEKSLSLVFRQLDGSFTVDGTVTASLTEILADSTDVSVPEDGFVITVHPQYKNAAAFAPFAVGDTVTLTCSAADGWEDVTTAVGGGDTLIENGIVCKNIADEAHEKTANPRTAIGWTADGTLKVFVVDGVSARTGSTGMNINSLAETMKNLGCVWAMNLDGGGSSTVLLRGEDGRLSVVSQPSDGTARAVSDAILFLSTAVSDGIPYGVMLTPSVPIVYRGSSVSFTPRIYDAAFAVTEMPDGAEIRYSASGGNITEDGSFTYDGVTPHPTVTVTVRFRRNGEETFFSDTAEVLTTDTLDALCVENTEVNAPFGGVSAPFSVYGLYHGYRVSVSPEKVNAVFATTRKSECPNGFFDKNLSVSTTWDGICGFRTVPAVLSVTNEDGSVCRASVTVLFGNPDEPFTDLGNSWAREDILTLYRMGIVNGAPDGFGGSAFSPAETLTRGEFAKMLCLLVMPDTADTAVLSRFADAEKLPAWAKPYIAAVVGAGLMNGKQTKDGLLFDAAGKMTRAEVFQVLGTLFAQNTESAVELPFTDTDGIPAWAVKNICVCWSNGLIGGFPDGSLRPLDTVTRAETAALFVRTARLLSR